MALRIVPEHPKFAHLQSILKLPKYGTLGILEALWHFCGRFTPQGNIGRYSDEKIESWIGWDGAPGLLIAALVESGWLDRDERHRLLVHDWREHADRTTRRNLARNGTEFIHLDGHVRDTSATLEGRAGTVARGSSQEAEPGADTQASVTIVELPAAPEAPPELWRGFVFAARKAGMTCANGQVAPLQRLFANLPLEQRKAAIRGIEQRLDSGEYADAHFVPAMKRYLGEQLWTANLRPGPQARARPPTRQERVRTAIAEAKESLRKETAYASG